MLGKKSSKSKTNVYYSTMGIVVAICCIFVVLGSLSGWQLYKVFTKESELIGEAKITQLPGDEEEIILSDDSSVFFSYAFATSSIFDLDNGTYNQKFIVDKLPYKPLEHDYTIYLNGNDCITTKEAGMVSAQVSMLYSDPHGEEYPAMFMIEFVFFNDRTTMRLSFTDKKVGGYLNQMFKSGLNIRIVEGPIVEKPKFENGGLTGLKVGDALPTLYINKDIKPTSLWFENGSDCEILSGENFSIICGLGGIGVSYKDKFGNDEYLSPRTGAVRDYVALPSDVDNTITNIASYSEQNWAQFISTNKFDNTSDCAKGQYPTPKLKYNPNGKCIDINDQSHPPEHSYSPMYSVQIYKDEIKISDYISNKGTIDIKDFTPGKYTMQVKSLVGNPSMFADSMVATYGHTVSAIDVLEDGESAETLYLNNSAEGEAYLKESFNKAYTRQDSGQYTESYMESRVTFKMSRFYLPGVMQGEECLILKLIRLAELLPSAKEDDFILVLYHDKVADHGAIGDSKISTDPIVLYSTSDFSSIAFTYGDTGTNGNKIISGVVGWQNISADGAVTINNCKYPIRTLYGYDAPNSWVKWLDNKPFE